MARRCSSARASAAGDFGIVAGFLHGAALLLGARLVAARVKLAALLVAAGLRLALVELAMRRLLALAVRRAFRAVGRLHQAGASQAANQERFAHARSHAKNCAGCRENFFVVDEHGWS